MYTVDVCLFGLRRPIPGREFVEVYIKAYYLPETQLETWIYDHKVSTFCMPCDICALILGFHNIYVGLIDDCGLPY